MDEWQLLDRSSFVGFRISISYQVDSMEYWDFYRIAVKRTQCVTADAISATTDRETE